MTPSAKLLPASIPQREKTLTARVQLAVKAYVRLWGARCLRFGQCFFFFLPIQRNKLAVYLHARRGYGCNLKYIVEAVLHSNPAAKVVWITPFPDAVAALCARGIRVVKLNTLPHWWHQFTSKAILISDALPASVRLRRGQIVMNAWHGGMNYKHIGPKYCRFDHPAQAKNFAAVNVQPHHYFSGSRFFTEDVCASFGFDPGVFRPIGMARNDLFFADMRPFREVIRKHFGLKTDDKIALYAPTFREDKCEHFFDLDVKRFLKALNIRFGGHWKLLYRNHYFVPSSGSSSDMIDASSYEDMSELLAATDALLTDYSSCLWDFALTGRPSFIYATDLEHYQQDERAFALPPEQWPCPVCSSNETLEQHVLTFDPDLHRKRLETHLSACGSYDDGHAAARAATIVNAALTS